MIYEKRDRVAWVTLNRPEHLNAYNLAMRDELYEVLTAVADDSELRAMVLAGAGRAFSTGGDVTEFGTAPSPIIARWARFRRDVWGRVRALAIPTVAAMHGLVVGGGLEMALLCDVAIAARDASIWLPETGLGMIPGVAGTQTLARRANVGVALDMCLTGRRIDAGQAMHLGLITEVVAPGNLECRAQELALALSAASPWLVAGLKLAVWEGIDLPMAEGLYLERRLARRLRVLTGLPVPERKAATAACREIEGL